MKKLMAIPGIGSWTAGSNGSLTGFSGGIQMKIKLLQLEGIDLAGMFVPKKGTAL